MTAPKLVSKAEAARIKQCSPSAISQACERDDLLRPALVDGRIDLNHPNAQRYLRRKGSVKPKRAREQDRRGSDTIGQNPQSEARDTDAPVENLLIDEGRQDVTTTKLPSKAVIQNPNLSPPRLNDDGFAEPILELSAREIAERWGTLVAYENWLDAYTKQQKAREVWLKNQRAEGTLIERDFVKTHVIAVIDTMSMKLLTDAVKTLSTHMLSLAKSGATAEQAEQDAREIIEKQLKATKRKVLRALKNA